MEIEKIGGKKLSKYIDSDKLYQKLDEHLSFGSTYTDYNCGYDDCLLWVKDTLLKMPKIEVPNAKHAHWECNGRCSNCEAFSVANGSDFCSNCGARMDGDENAV